MIYFRIHALTAVCSLILDKVVQELLVVQLHIVRMLPPCRAGNLSIGEGEVPTNCLWTLPVVRRLYVLRTVTVACAQRVTILQHGRQC